MTCHHYHNMKYYRKQINLSCVYCFCSFAFKNHVSYHVSFKFMLECFTESSVIIIVPLKNVFTWSGEIFLSRCPSWPSTCCRYKCRTGHVMFRGAFIIHNIVMTWSWHWLQRRKRHSRCRNTQVMLVTESYINRQYKEHHYSRFFAHFQYSVMPAFNIRLKPNQDTQCSLSQNLCPSVCSDCWLARKNPKMSNLNLFFLPASVCIIKKNITSIVRTENCGNLNFTHAAIHQMQGRAQHNCIGSRPLL